MFTISVNPPKPRVEAYTMSGPLRVAVPRATHSPSPSPAPHSPSPSPALSRTRTRTARRPPAHPTGVLESVVRMCTTWCAVVVRSLIPTGQCTAQSSPPGSVALQPISSDATPIPTRSPGCRHPRHTLASPTLLAQPNPFLSVRHTHPRSFAGARLRITAAIAHALTAIGGDARRASM